MIIHIKGHTRWRNATTPSCLSIDSGLLHLPPVSLRRMRAGTIVGIDFGTRRSAVAVWKDGRPHIIPNDRGWRTTPSTIAFLSTGERIVGHAAEQQAPLNPSRTVTSIKRLMGRRNCEVAKEKLRTAFEVAGKAADPVLLRIGDAEYTAPEVAAILLQDLSTAATAYLGQEAKRAVITVPANFDYAQRQAIRDAGTISGLEVVRLVNEPTAAALACTRARGTIAIFDFGGGSFDISILEISDDVTQVLSTNGDAHLGGDDIDTTLMDYLAEDFESRSRVDPSGDAVAMQRLRQAAEAAKCELSVQRHVRVRLPGFAGGWTLDTQLSRARFEQLIDPITERLRDPCSRALKDAGLSPSNIDKVILVGHTSRIPLVQLVANEIFEKRPVHMIDLDEAVALGAATQGAILAGHDDVKEAMLLDVAPSTLGIETEGGVMTPIIERNTLIPAIRARVFSTASDYQNLVEVNVLQGERPMARNNRSLAKLILEEIPSAPRGVPQIEVNFSVDANAILDVTARDVNTGQQREVRVEGVSQFSIADIDRLREEADKRGREEQERRALEDKVYQHSTRVRGLDEDDGAHLLLRAAELALHRRDYAAVQRHLDDLQSRLPPEQGGS